MLVGDPAKFTAIEAGGAFAMLVRDRVAPPQLTEVHRFGHEWERAASLRLHAGDAAVIEQYESHDRIRAGDRSDMLTALYKAWRADPDAGLDSLIIAPDPGSRIDR